MPSSQEIESFLASHSSALFLGKTSQLSDEDSEKNSDYEILYSMPSGLVDCTVGLRNLFHHHCSIPSASHFDHLQQMKELEQSLTK